MPLFSIKQMIHHADRHGYSLGGFEVADIESIDAVLSAAAACRAPVLLDISQAMGTMQAGMLLAAAEHAARQASIPVGLVSTGVTQAAMAVNAIRDGSNGLSIDLSGFTHAEKIERSRSLMRTCRDCGVPAEGLVAQLENDAGTAKAIIEQSGIDMLAYFLDADAPDLSATQMAHILIGIKREIDVPLSIHGAGLLDNSNIQIVREVGIAAMHFAAATNATVSHDALRQYTLDRLQALGCSEHAGEILADCARWEPVEHVIVFNVETNNGVDIDTILARGRQVLGEIPGVRYVYTGQAIQKNAAYRFCWLVRFVHPAVIETYREHPDHKKFADELFRPIAPTRMSIDFYMTTDTGKSQSLHGVKLEPAQSGPTHRLDSLTAL